VFSLLVCFQNILSGFEGAANDFVIEDWHFQFADEKSHYCYRWHQTFDEVTVAVPLLGGLTPAKDIKVVFQPTHLSVQVTDATTKPLTLSAMVTSGKRFSHTGD
jgi:hypothetical protein